MNTPLIPSILDLRGIPQLSPACLARVRAVDPRFNVQFIDGMLGGYWGLTQRWRDDDQRWERVRSGEYPPDKTFDLVFHFPRNCPMESIAAYVENHYGHRHVSDPAKEATRMVEAQAKQHAIAKEEKMDVFLDRQEQQVKDMTDHQRRVLAGAETAHPMIYGFGDAGKPGRGKKKPQGA